MSYIDSVFLVLNHRNLRSDVSDIDALSVFWLCHWFHCFCLFHLFFHFVCCFTLVPDYLIDAMFLIIYDLTVLSYAFDVNNLRVYCWSFFVCLTQVVNIGPTASHIASAVYLYLHHILKTIRTPCINMFPYPLLHICVQNFLTK